MKANNEIQSRRTNQKRIKKMNIIYTTAGEVATATDSAAFDWLLTGAPGSQHGHESTSDLPDDCDGAPIMLMVNDRGVIREYALGHDPGKIDGWNKCAPIPGRALASDWTAAQFLIDCGW